MRGFKRLLLAVFVVVLAQLYRVYTNHNYPVSFAFWNATEEDIAEAFVHDTNGKLLYETSGFVPASIQTQGWRSGAGLTNDFSEFPEKVLVSWRKPSPQETPAQRCRRRMEENCERLGVPGRVMYRDGELVGPFHVDLRSLIPDHEWGLLQRRGLYSHMAFGFSVGVNPPQVRWVLRGAVEGTSLWDQDPRITSLSYGGDWGVYKPWGFDRPQIPIPPAPPRGKPP